MVAAIRPNYTIQGPLPGQMYEARREQRLAQEEAARQQAIAQEQNAKRQAALERILGVPSSASATGSVGVPAAAAPGGAPAMEATPGYVAPGETPTPVPTQAQTAVPVNPSVEDYLKAAALFPELKDQFTQLAEQRGQQVTRNELFNAGRVFTALNSGNVQTAADIASRQAEAARNSGDIQSAKAYETWAGLIVADPDATRDSIAIYMASTPGGKEALETSFKASEEMRKRDLAPIEIKKAQRELDLTDAQVLQTLKDIDVKNATLKKTALELKAMEAGTLSPDKKFDKERTLNQEYYKRTEGLRDSNRNYEVIKNSAADDSGAGDIALVTSFMKMLDPGSVVRETEFANARDTVGLLDKLRNQSEEIKTGKFLSPSQRQDFVRLADQYLKAAEREGLAARRSIETLVNTYNLNPQAVFGLPEAPAETQAPPPATPPATAQPSSVRQEADAILAGG